MKKLGIGLLAILSGTDSASARGLTLEQRIEAQAVIDRFYRSHQTGGSGTIDGNISRPILEARVETYLRQSDALEKLWEAPVTQRALGTTPDCPG